MGAMASKKASSASPVSAWMALRQRRRGEGAGRHDHAVPVGGRQARDLLARDLDQRMRFERAASPRAAKPSRSTASAPPAGSLLASAAAMISEPARRISSCSSPTALVSHSSERKEFEQTSSAKAPVLMRLGLARRGASRAARPARRLARAARPPRCPPSRRRSHEPCLPCLIARPLWAQRSSQPKRAWPSPWILATNWAKR